MKKYFLAFATIILGLVVGIVLLELILIANPGLLLRGMALPAPKDLPIFHQSYDVHNSDGDVFIWRPDLVRPIAAKDDHLEAHVDYVTDEFGFRNQPPVADIVDIVVLGRSISLGAHIQKPWPTLLAKMTDKKVLNLSQPGSGIDLKNEYLERFGINHSPTWVILEVVPKIDILDHQNPQPFLSQRVVFPMIQSIWRRYSDSERPNLDGAEIYPITINLPGRTFDLTCCIHYMEFYTLNQELIEGSQDWIYFEEEILRLIRLAKSNSACVALLYVPTKPDVYFPLVAESGQLAPSLRDVTSYSVDDNGYLVTSSASSVDVKTIQENSFAGRDVIQSFAQRYRLPFIDPSEKMIQSVMHGNDPFMMYDSHWNALGHEIVAEEVANVLRFADCP